VSFTVAPATDAPEESVTKPETLVELADCAWSETGHSAKTQSNTASIVTKFFFAKRHTDMKLQRGRTCIDHSPTTRIFLTPGQTHSNA
jgi:hypothetical protein